MYHKAGEECKIHGLEEDDHLVCFGYKKNYCKYFLYFLLILCTGGLAWLVFYWKSNWKLKFTHSKCRLHEATSVLIKTAHDLWCVEKIHSCQLKEIDLEDPLVPHVRTLDSHTDYSSEDIWESGPEDGCVQSSEQRNSYTKLQGDVIYSEDVEPEEKLSPTSSVPLLQKPNGQDAGNMSLRYFIHRQLKYIWNPKECTFSLLRGLDDDTTVSEIYQASRGLSSETRAHRYMIYGPNVIDVEVKSYVRLFFEEGADPFYIFQVCSCILWFSDEYIYYASCILFVSLVSIMMTIQEEKRQMKKLHSMVALADSVTILLRNGETQVISSKDLVPGDVIVIPKQGMHMLCDAALISGNCIVSESMLTGESVPITKTPLPRPNRSRNAKRKNTPDKLYNPEAEKKHTLFNGTRVIQTRYYAGNARVLAVVIRTGFSTTKGMLVRSILNPKPVGFKFFRDSMKFIGILAVLALIGFCYSIYALHRLEYTTLEIFLSALDVITIAVPPALPAAMAAGTVYALRRLQKKSIMCIAPPRINMCGKIKLFCFDKTGTLTEDGLDLLGVVPVNKDNKFDLIIKDCTHLQRGPLLNAMATCHSLTIIDNEIAGDPLDIKMFEATQWVLEEPGEDATKFESAVPTVVKPKSNEKFTVESALEGQTPYEVAIIKQFPFSSDLQRMSVIARTLGSKCMDVYMKGAPEKVISLCRPESVPENVDEVLKEYTQHGYRVLGVASKQLGPKVSWLQAQRSGRENYECDLSFIGLLVMENALKEESAPVIKELQEANIRTVMITGDNMLTAASVARECGMVGETEKIYLVNATKPADPTLPPEVSYSLLGEIHGNTVQSAYHCRDTKRLARKDYHLACSGKTYAIIRQYCPDVSQKLSLCGTVFARFSPEQKTQVVEDLQKLDYCVGMCGDGANDCGALKLAHAGISLSEAEASVASPFTSKITNISCVPTTIKEGRAALVTSFGVFKYMALYSIVQFVSVILLYTEGSNLGDLQYLYIDLALILVIAFCMGLNSAYPHLVPRRPGGSLIAPMVLASLFSQIILQIGVQVGTLFYVRSEPWFTPIIIEDLEDVQILSYENTAIFCITCYQYILLAVAFSKGPPYRQPFYKNWPFLISLILLTVWTIFITVRPGEVLREELELMDIPDEIFTLTLVGIAAFNFIASVAIEDYFLPLPCVKRFFNKMRGKKEPKNYYKRLEKSLKEDYHWPPPVVDPVA